MYKYSDYPSRSPTNRPNFNHPSGCFFLPQFFSPFVLSAAATATVVAKSLGLLIASTFFRQVIAWAVVAAATACSIRGVDLIAAATSQPKC